MFIVASLMSLAFCSGLEEQRLGIPQIPAIPGNRYLCIHSIQFQLHRIVRLRIVDHRNMRVNIITFLSLSSCDRHVYII